MSTQATLHTSLGDIIVELFPNHAPKTVANFVELATGAREWVDPRTGEKSNANLYDGTVFHRVIDGFMVQAGGFNAAMIQKPTRAPIALEANNGLRNERGTIAMARTNIPNSATSQFFINVVDNENLNAPQPDGFGYAVFGRVISGMEVIDKIRLVPVGNRAGMQNVPLQSITINSVRTIK